MSSQQNSDHQISQQNFINVENNQIEQLIQNDDQFSQDFQSDNQNPPQLDKQQIKQVQNLPKVSNPISPYGIFTKQYRQKHAGQKISMSTFGQIWNSLCPEQKNVYQQKFKEEKQKYQQYEAYMLSIDPNYGKKSKPSANLLFPLHRVKSIMKQDNAYTASTENVSAMTKAVQYFGEYLLQEVKKSAEGNKRIDLQNLFEAVNNNQSNLWFLNCLIDQHNISQGHSNKVVITEQRKSNQMNNISHTQQKMIEQKPKKMQKAPPTSNKKKNQLLKGQMKLTDMF